MRVHRNDTVVIITGKERDKRGKVQLVLPKTGQVIVESLNMVTRHQKATAMMRQAGIIKKEAPLPLAKVMVVCPRCNKGVRVGYRTLEDGRKVRVCRKCKEMIDL